MKYVLENLNFEDFDGQFQDKYKNFLSGTVIKTNKGIYLIGDVNGQLGFCDHCGFDRDEKILEVGHISQLISNTENCTD